MLGVVPSARARLDSADAAPAGRRSDTPVNRPLTIAVVRRNSRPVDILTLFPIIILIGFMFVMTRSAKKKQQQAAEMRDSMQPGTGVRTIGGMYATVKEVNDETVLLDAGPGVELLFAKNAIGAVLTDDEYNRIVHGIEAELQGDVVPDDASSLTDADDADAGAAADGRTVDLGKTEDAPRKTDGESDAK